MFIYVCVYACVYCIIQCSRENRARKRGYCIDHTLIRLLIFFISMRMCLHMVLLTYICILCKVYLLILSGYKFYYPGIL